jgi:hypothetical protein
MLIEFGVFESALLDALAAAEEFTSHEDVVHALRCVTRHLADRFVSACADIPPRTEAPARVALQRLTAAPLPSELETTRPEGFAYWGLYPEQYVDAARRFLQADPPKSAVVIGVRSIGTSLSSVVESYLAANGVSTTSISVRPSGHPFARRMQFNSGDLERLRRGAFERFLIVDEGPGLSGTTMTSIARSLTDLDIPPERVALFPSYESDGTAFVSEEARLIWSRHPRYVGRFDPIQLLPRTVDLSAGRWRTELTGLNSEGIPVVPHHERRKYLERSQQGFPLRIYRYCGLGPLGDLVHARARVLQESGFVPPVGSVQNGLMEVHYVPGQPLLTPRATPELLNAIAAYVAFRANALGSTAPPASPRLVPMLRTNVSEGLGEEYAGDVDVLAQMAGEGVERTCCVDGRMQPHEWISTVDGYAKVDAFDHGDDHFFPGPCDIAWDLVGAAVEFELTESELAILLDGYVRRTGDASLEHRLPFYSAAYLAFRMGYCELTHSTLGTEPARQQLLRLGQYYRACLRGLLSARRKKAEITALSAPRAWARLGASRD